MIVNRFKLITLAATATLGLLLAGGQAHGASVSVQATAQATDQATSLPGATIQPTTAATANGTVPTVFLILMENHDWSAIKGSPSAPYINTTLLPIAAHAERYLNVPNLHPSLPNYLWLEGGTRLRRFG